jgi:hypothetical protein
MSKKTKPSRHINTNSAKIESTYKKTLPWIELGTAVTLMLTLVILHFTVFLHSGALWRDEVSSVNLINLPSVDGFWEKFQFDSFPILWILLLQTWSFAGFGTSDFALRGLGLIMGLGTLGSLWYAARALRMRLPLISLVLFAMCPTIFAVDSLRAYGLGVLLILLALATMWRVLEDPTPWRMVLCAMAVILSVQSLYNNSFLIFAICLGAAAVGLYRHQWKLTLFPLGVGMLAAASLLPYLGIISRVGDINKIVVVPINLSWFFNKFQQAIDPSGMLLTWIWAVLGLLAVVFFVWLLVRYSSDCYGKQKELAVFLLTTMVVSIIAYIAFVKILSFTTESWYYLPLMAVLIIIIDKGIDVICKIYPPGRIIRIACILVIAIAVFMNSWNAAHIRKTNIDLLAAKLETLADKDDLIVVSPFFYGITFARYYNGSTAWTTLPEITDQSAQRVDLFKIKMMQNEPIKPVLQKMTKTLQNGHRVWLVGRLNFLLPGEAPTILPPAPNSPYGWSALSYMTTWSEEAAFALQTYGRSLEEISIPCVDQVSKFENVPLFVVNGRQRGR